MNQFSQLGLSDPILKVLLELGFDNPTNIQQEAIPVLLGESTDFIGMAQTGTGKTAAFGLPLLDKIDPQYQHTQALILAPTRELVQQIGSQLDIFAKYLPKLRLTTVYGGAPIQNQISSIKKNNPHVIIATPGRLMDLMSRRVIHLDEISSLILDEADEMLNMGFKEDIDKILQYTPDTCKTWLFSATMPSEIREIIRNYMVQPKEVKIAPKNIVNTDITHHYYLVKRDDKTEALVRILDSNPDMVGIIFCRTKMDTQHLADELTARGYLIEALHGDMNQNQRDRVMSKFKDHKIKLLTATDVAARGIDVKNLTHVIHHSLPDDAEYYTHRSGRTARGGNTGVSLALATGGDIRKVEMLARKLKVGFNKAELPSSAEIVSQRLEKWVEDIHATKPSVDEFTLEAMEALLGTVSKSDLIARLLTLEVERMKLSEVDLVEPDVFSDRKDGRGRDRNRRRKRDFSRNKSGDYPSASAHSFNSKSKKKKKSDGGGGSKDGSGYSGDKKKKSKRAMSRRRY